MLKHLVLGIGYEQNEYERTQEEWRKHDVDIRIASSVDEAINKLLTLDIVCVIICSYTQDYTLYLDVIREIRPVMPIVVMSPEYSIEQRAEFINASATQFILENGKKEIATKSGLEAVDFYLNFSHKGEYPLSIIVDKDLYFCLEYRTVKVQNQEVELTPLEFEALHLLLKNKKRVLTFEVITSHVWGDEYIDKSSKAVTNLMARLRNKLKINDDTPDYIKGVRGIGYKFDPSSK